MKKTSFPSLLLVLAILSVAAAPVPASTTLERTFRYEASRLGLDRAADGATRVRMARSDRETRPGHPDLPLAGERVELPVGTRLVSVEVLDAVTVSLARGVRVPSTPLTRPGIEELVRTEPDPALFGRAGFVPDPLATVGLQGFERGRNVAHVVVAPVRWDPATGDLERVESLRVRLVLEDTEARPLERGRVVAQWEDGAAVTRAAAPARALAFGGRDAEPFKATQVPSLLGSPVAYVIVTNDAMAPAFQRLADWKTQSGVPAVVRTVSFIREQYPSGSDDGERIRLFLRDAYARWGTKWVLLGGDTDVIPVRLGYTTYYGSENIATDLYYSCLDGNWDNDGDHLFGEGVVVSPYSAGDAADLMPEVYVGRAPASTLAEAELFVDKSIGYVRTPVHDSINSMLCFAEVLFPQDWVAGMTTVLDGAELIEYDMLPIMDDAPQVRVVRLYENHTDVRWRPGALLETKAIVVDSLDRGYNVAVHVGHGYRNVMHVGNADLSNSDALAMTNGARLSNLYAINCSSTAIDYSCISEAWMKNPHGGAVTVVGSTRFDFPTYGRQYQEEYFALLYQRGVNAIGELQARQKLPYVGQSSMDGVHRWTQMTLILLGDPELRIYTDTPRTLAVTHPASLPVSDSTVAVHVAVGGVPVDSATVTLYRAGDLYVSGVTDAAGDLTLPVRPDTLGALTLTVTGYNCTPYQASVAVVAGGAPALAERTVTVYDDGTVGSVGNGDGLWDAGETVALSPVLQNNGGVAAGSLSATLSTTDGLVTLHSAAASYGTVAAGDSAGPMPPFVVQIPYTAGDQREVPFTLRLTDAGGRTYVQRFSVVLRAPELSHFAHNVVDLGGNLNSRPDPGENVSYFVRLRNLGTGTAQSVTATLRSPDGLSAVTDSTAAWGDLAPGQEATGDAFAFTPSASGAKLQLTVSDGWGVRSVQTLDLVYPATPGSLAGLGGPSGISLTWTKVADTDLWGYVVYRSSSQAGPFTRANSVPTGRISYYYDPGLTPLTRYYHKIAAVDSSGNESTLSSVLVTSTNPPTHSIFPIPTGRTTPAPVAVDHIYGDHSQSLVVGSDLLYLWHPDGTTPVDADGSGSTSGDFTTVGSYYAAGPTVADLDGGSKEIIAPTWFNVGDTGVGKVCVFGADGLMKPGWPVQLLDNLWSSIAVGDLRGDGDKQLVLGSNGSRIYAFESDGTELLDGDSNPATIGVFKVIAGAFNPGTAAIAPIEGDGSQAILYGGADGKLYAWRANGTDVPGFPVTLNAGIRCSPAVGRLDGPGGPLTIVCNTYGDGLYAIRTDGTIRTGFPVWPRLEVVSKTPSPALADMNADGYLDIVQATTSGGINVYDRNGAIVAPWNGVRYSTLTSYATECSPVVADMNGDGRPDVMMGDENGQLTALSGLDASVLPGFPIQLTGEVRGTPALCDCDGDGMTEIVLASWDKNVYVWDYDFPFSPGAVPPWPQFHHDAARTGYAETAMYVDVPTGGGTVVRRLELAPPVPNPAHGGTRLWYSVPAGRAGETLDLAVFDLSGRRVRTLAAGRAEAGRHSAEWDLRDATGSPSRAGVYFARIALGGESLSRKVVLVR